MRINKSLYLILLPFILVFFLTFYNKEDGVKIYLPSLFSEQYLDSTDLLGKPYILNVFNSWCASCKEEHDLWLKTKDEISLYGISYVDNIKQAQKFLQDYGNPYLITGFDKRGITSETLHIKALPETFIIDKLGKVKLHIIGPVTAERVSEEILPLYRKLLQK